MPYRRASTVHALLTRHGLIDRESPAHSCAQRFEAPAPNVLWQMDFKGHFALLDGARCHALTVLDDHSRFALCLAACANEQGVTVKRALRTVFERYGLPARMTMDNGAPWGDCVGSPYTPLTVWFIRLGIAVSHSRPYHPQTQGKDERFHRSLQAEVLDRENLFDLRAAQQRFERWRHLYNFERPHQALNYRVPAERYAPSPRAFPSTLAPIEYPPDACVRRVGDHGQIHYHGRLLQVSKAFHGYPVALYPTTHDGVLSICFCHHMITRVDLHQL